jgi:hypothetical protein
MRGPPGGGMFWCNPPFSIFKKFSRQALRAAGRLGFHAGERG